MIMRPAGYTRIVLPGCVPLRAQYRREFIYSDLLHDGGSPEEILKPRIREWICRRKSGMFNKINPIRYKIYCPLMGSSIAVIGVLKNQTECLKNNGHGGKCYEIKKLNKSVCFKNNLFPLYRTSGPMDTRTCLRGPSRGSAQASNTEWSGAERSELKCLILNDGRRDGGNFILERILNCTDGSSLPGTVEVEMMKQESYTTLTLVLHRCICIMDCRSRKDIARKVSAKSRETRRPKEGRPAQARGAASGGGVCFLVSFPRKPRSAFGVWVMKTASNAVLYTNKPP